jgi:hypothetical protein
LISLDSSNALAQVNAQRLYRKGINFASTLLFAQVRVELPVVFSPADLDKNVPAD